MPKIFVHVVTFVVDSPHLYYAWNGVLLKQSEMKKKRGFPPSAYRNEYVHMLDQPAIR
jgi:hypothetical protein